MERPSDAPPYGLTTPTLDNSTWRNTSATASVPPDADMAADAIWILTSTFIIFTMQSGFGLLESGSVSTKNEVNIMVKNAVDVIMGGLSFWMFGYAFSFGNGEYSNAFCGWGHFFVTVNTNLGNTYSKFFFQASFATTSTTIVSGAMAERTRLEAYIVFSFVNTLIFCFPAHWVWDEKGWLSKLGFVDVAGSGPVHLIGGLTGLVATLVLKPRRGRFNSKYAPQMGSPTNAMLGMFMLWWGWLGFNCGSTFGISGFKWKLAARSAVSTLNASIGGGCVGLLFSYISEKRKFDVSYLINGVLGSLVGLTAFCALAEPWQGLVIGSVGAILALFFCKLEEKLHIDDPVGCVGVHAVAGMWGLLSVGLFSKKDDLKKSILIHPDIPGLFYGGGPYLLGVQLAGIVVLSAWAIFWSYIVLKLIDVTIGLRVSPEHEILGADLVEHGVGNVDYDKSSSTVIGLKSDAMSAQKITLSYAGTTIVTTAENCIRDMLAHSLSTETAQTLFSTTANEGNSEDIDSVGEDSGGHKTTTGRSSIVELDACLSDHPCRTRTPSGDKVCFRDLCGKRKRSKTYDLPPDKNENVHARSNNVGQQHSVPSVSNRVSQRMEYENKAYTTVFSTNSKNKARE